MNELQIYLLGSFQASWDFRPVAPAAWGDRHASRLLQLLLIRRPDPVTAEEAARILRLQDLTAAIAGVNRVISPAAQLEATPGGLILFRQGPHCWIDLDAMLSQYQAGVSAALRGEMLAAVLAFQEADGLYQGDLLEELHDSWVTEPRRRLQIIYTEILDRLAEGHAVLARFQDAVGFCHKALAHDPLREATYQRMMVYYYYLGDKTGAREAFDACRQALAENHRYPSSETQALWAELNREQTPEEWPVAMAAPGFDPPDSTPGQGESEPAN